MSIVFDFFPGAERTGLFFCPPLSGPGFLFVPPRAARVLAANTLA
jgi:hypothetical protein